MKKMAVVIMVSMILLCSCSGASESAASLNMSGLADTVSAKLSETDDMVKLSDEKASDFYDLSFDGLSEYTIYVSGSRATANELCIMILKDEDSVANAKASIEKRIDEQKASYENYIPAEYDKIQNAVIKTEGNYIVMAVGIDSDSLEKMIKDNLK